MKNERIGKCWFSNMIVLLVVALICGASAHAQVIRTISNDTFTFRFEFHGIGDPPVCDDDPNTWNFATKQMDAVVRAGEYWLERLNPQTTGTVRFIVGAVDGDVAHAHLDGTAWNAIINGGNGVGIMCYGGTLPWITSLNSQLHEKSGASLESIVIHEMGHLLGIGADSVWNYNFTTGQWDFEKIVPGPWADLISLYPYGALYGLPEDHTGPFYFTGATATAVFGDVWAGNEVRWIRLDGGPSGKLEHPDTLIHYLVMNGLMSHTHYRNYSGFMEVELAGLIDIGHNINLRQFFGRSVYRDDQTIVYTDGFFQHDGKNYLIGTHNRASYGLGLHIYASDIDITVRGNDILSIGVGGAGIRSDGFNNTITIAEGVRVHADGARGTGLLVAYGIGTNIIHRGDLQAVGKGGIAARFDFGYNILGPDGIGNLSSANVLLPPPSLRGPFLFSSGNLVETFDVYGSITGSRAAIWIADNAWVETINVHGGASIVGDIISFGDTTPDFATNVNFNGYNGNDRIDLFGNINLRAGSVNVGTDGRDTTLVLLGAETIISADNIVFGADSDVAFNLNRAVALGEVDHTVSLTLNGNATGKAIGFDTLEVNSLLGLATGQTVRLVDATGNGSVISDTGNIHIISGGGAATLIKNNGFLNLQITDAALYADLQGFNPNARRVAGGMDTIVDRRLTGNIRDLHRELRLLSDDHQALANAFAGLSGEVFATSQMTVANMQRTFQRRLPGVTDRFTNHRSGNMYRGAAPCERVAPSRAACSCCSVNLWGSFTGDWQDQRNIGGDNGYSGFNLRTAGVAVGFDQKLSRNAFAGVAFGHDNAYLRLSTLDSYNQIDVFRTVFYGGWRRGNTFTDVYAGYTKHWHNIRRDINVASFNETARSSYSDNMFSTGLEVGRNLSLGGGARLTPSVGLHYIHLSTPSLTETGGSDANLHARSSRYNSVRMPIGARMSQDIRRGILWIPEVRAFYICELADTSARVWTSFNEVRSVSFVADSGNWGRSSGRFGTGINAQFSDSLNFRVDYDYEVFEHTSTSALGATLGVRW